MSMKRFDNIVGSPEGLIAKAKEKGLSSDYKVDKVLAMPIGVLMRTTKKGQLMKLGVDMNIFLLISDDAATIVNKDGDFLGMMNIEKRKERDFYGKEHYVIPDEVDEEALHRSIAFETAHNIMAGNTDFIKRLPKGYVHYNSHFREYLDEELDNMLKDLNGPSKSLVTPEMILTAKKNSDKGVKVLDKRVKEAAHDFDVEFKKYERGMKKVGKREVSGREA